MLNGQYISNLLCGDFDMDDHAFRSSQLMDHIDVVLGWRVPRNPTFIGAQCDGDIIAIVIVTIFIQINL